MIKKVLIVLSMLLLTGAAARSQSDNRSFDALMKAANKGDSQSQAMVAYRLKEGVGVKKDLNEAKRWAQIASQHRNGLGFWLLAQMSREAGESLSSYRRYLDSAMSCNYPLALSFFARLYESGSPEFGIEKDESMALELFREAAEYGDAESATRAGYLYLRDRNDPLSAVEYFDKAVAKGEAEAMGMLASIYFNGIGTAKDHDKAIDLFRKAADAGSSYGAVCYGRIQSSSIENLNMPIQECLDAFSQIPVASPETVLNQVTFEYPVPLDTVVYEDEDLDDEEAPQPVQVETAPVRQQPRAEKVKTPKRTGKDPSRTRFVIKAGSALLQFDEGSTIYPISAGLGLYNISQSRFGFEVGGYWISGDGSGGKATYSNLYMASASLALRAAKGVYPKVGAGFFQLDSAGSSRATNGISGVIGLTFLLGPLCLEIGANYYPEIQTRGEKWVSTAGVEYIFPTNTVLFSGFVPTASIGFAF